MDTYSQNFVLGHFRSKGAMLLLGNTQQLGRKQSLCCPELSK